MGPYPKKRKAQPKVEEVNFDPEARHEFLTGFHKRKVQRMKHAQDAAEKRMREEKRQDRKKLREERAAEFNRVVAEHKRVLQEIKEANSDIESSDSEDESDQEWEGIEEPPAVDYEAEYVDEDKYTTVTVEEMDASREGIRKSINGENSDDEEKKEYPQPEEPEKKPAKKARKSSSDIKKKKKQFRYESKSDRKLTQAKQRLSKSKKAKSRREQ